MGTPLEGGKRMERKDFIEKLNYRIAEKESNDICFWCFYCNTGNMKCYRFNDKVGIEDVGPLFSVNRNGTCDRFDRDD
jgi:hypothetical protein